MTESEFETFFHDNFESIRRYLFYRSNDKELSTDIAQESMLRIWERNVKLEGKRTVGFAYKIANDLLVDRFRENNAQMNYINNISFDFNGQNPEKELQFKELKADFEKKLADMTDSQRVVFLMSRMDGLKNREIAEKLNISIKAVEKRMSGALVIIKEFGKTIYSIMISVLVYSLKFLSVI
ncbi:sigma-70 family RNA polymerase sigma factor [Carboxylicivirga sediminis]|uniref:Sigma-70 family RNA polymerase sigma factor n=1 Tax=Carboxylicivirga sediminis TaxID=2006564 RepID=A0A941IXF2_9BACT|nr:sigma-70 family RNA polymerase sigma factor [Carboxylicivirga sediminis]MBR8536716.1 sigma-70 family RNA polymerase sigma factor [Carboxylicivirga sediminis]